MAPMNSPAARASRPARYYVNGHFAPPTASPAYTVGLCAAAAAMVVLPLIYLALVTLVGWLVFLHAIRDFGILAMDGDIRARIIFYFGPLVVGLIASPERIVQIRRNRLMALHETQETDYVAEDRVRDEMASARKLFLMKGWPMIDVSRRAIEETAAAVIALLNRRRNEGLTLAGNNDF